MRLATVAQSRRIDELSQERASLTAEVLMEAAGAVSAREIELAFVPELRQRERPLAVVCGPGNNGADGLVVARHLQAAGHRHVTVVLAAPPNKRSELFRLQLRRCEKQSITILDFSEEKELSQNCLLAARLIVDAIYGIGFRGELTGAALDLVETMNRAGASVASLDAPSGLDADRGIVRGAAVKAALTLTFGLAKPGFFLSDGPAVVGRLRVLPIGFPLRVREEVASTHFAFTEKMAERRIPKRAATSHKTDHGHALILAGSQGMWGASVLSASAAYRMGAGYVTLASHDDPGPTMAQALPEVLTSIATDEKLWSNDRKWTAAAIGPGFGTDDKTKNVLEKLLALRESRVVVDADAITVLAAGEYGLLPPNWVLTPHAGELARLLKGPSAKEIESDRCRYALEAAKKTGATVVLKGYRTVVARGERCWIILAGNAALAKAGTGDVLTGMIASLLAQKLSPLGAACTAAYVHGRIADEWVRAGNHRGSMEAGDLREILPGLLERLAQSPSLR